LSVLPFYTRAFSRSCGHWATRVVTTPFDATPELGAGSTRVRQQPLMRRCRSLRGAYQFDWSHETVVLIGVTVTVKVAHVCLCHSRMMFVRAYPRETQETVFDAHERAFALFPAPTAPS
jgi:hypothetical protein